MIRLYNHTLACQRIVERVRIFGATTEEMEEATEAVCQALVTLAIGASDKQLEAAEENALAPYKAVVTARKEKARLESEKDTQRRIAGFKVDFQLDHIERYLEKEYEFDGGFREMRREADKLRPLIREALIEEVLENRDMSGEKIRESIEDQIDERV